MGRRIKISFPEHGIEIIADLNEEAAPDTCEHVWKSLEKPMEGPFHHGHETGLRYSS